MKNIKLIIVTFIFLVLTACSGSPLFDPNAGASLPPDGKLFAQISFETVGDHHDFQVGDYAVHLEKAAFVSGNFSFLTTAVTTQPLHHEGEHPEGSETEDSHGEPSSCPFDGSLSSLFYLDLTEHASLPCLTLNEGAYTGLHFEFHAPAGPVEGLPADTSTTLWIKGHAMKGGVEYPFELKGNWEKTVELAGPLNLNGDSHHVTVRVDIAGWFHGMDFAALDQEGGVILLDESHNEDRYEHFLDHVEESFLL